MPSGNRSNIASTTLTERSAPLVPRRLCCDSFREICRVHNARNGAILAMDIVTLCLLAEYLGSERFGAHSLRGVSGRYGRDV